MHIVGSVLGYCWIAFLTTLLQIFIVLGPGLVLAFAMSYLAGFIQDRAQSAMGRAWYLGLFGWLGTMMHEFGHAIFCVLFGHRITDIKLFDPDPSSGALGYVSHSYNPNNLYQRIGNFFVGIGPILFGTGVIYALSIYVVGSDVLSASDFEVATTELGSWQVTSSLFDNLWTALGNILSDVFSWDNFASWRLWVFLYLVFSIGSSITLSSADLRGAVSGFATVVGAWLLFNLATLWLGNFTTDACASLAEYCGIFYAIMFLALCMNVFVAAIVLFSQRSIRQVV